MSQFGTLFIIGTPIGNLEDASPRSRRILASVDILAAEDTRTARKLLGHFGISPPSIVSYFEGNEAARTSTLLEELAQGKSIGLVSEAGMPSVSDPGQRLVAAAAEAGHTIVPILGPSAVLGALVGSGLPSQHFSFLGFLPREKGPRRMALGRLRERNETLVFYESPERTGACLSDMAEAFGDERKVVLARELTKMYEEFVHGTCASLAERFASKAPRGECTLVVEGASEEKNDIPSENLEDLVRELLAQGLGPKDVAARLMVRTGKARRELYQLALSLKRS